MRRDFHLPEQDSDYLDSTGLPWETISQNGNWVVVRNYPVPSGYRVNEVSVALKVPNGYPVAQLDMAYFFPPIQRTDGKQIRALAGQQLEGKQWQRWSRHRTPQNPWRPEVDCIATHMGLVDHWLEREFEIR